MGQVLGELTLPAMGVVLSPIPIVATILMLLSPRGRLNSVMFLIGWLVGLSAVVGLVIVLIGDSSASGSDSNHSTVAGLIDLAIALALWAVAIRQIRHRPGPGEKATAPKWMSGLETVSPLVALCIGLALAAFNPENFLFDISAASVISEGELSSAQTINAGLFFVVFASVSVIAPMVWLTFGGDHARKELPAIRDWLIQRNGLIIAIVCIMLGAGLFGKAISAFFG